MPIRKTSNFGGTLWLKSQFLKVYYVAFCFAQIPGLVLVCQSPPHYNVA